MFSFTVNLGSNRRLARSTTTSCGNQAKQLCQVIEKRRNRSQYNIDTVLAKKESTIITDAVRCPNPRTCAFSERVSDIACCRTRVRLATESWRVRKRRKTAIAPKIVAPPLVGTKTPSGSPWLRCVRQYIRKRSVFPAKQHTPASRTHLP